MGAVLSSAARMIAGRESVMGGRWEWVVGPGKLFLMIHPLFHSFIPKISAYYSLKPAHYSQLFPKHD